MTKKELILKGKKLGLKLSEKSLKAELESAVNEAEKKATPSTRKVGGEY